jgi:hypothetical protein
MAAKANQLVQTVLDHQRRDRRDLGHLMAQGFRIRTLQKRAATAASIWVVLHHLIHSFDRQQLRTATWMALFPSTHAATARWMAVTAARKMLV